MTSHIYPIIFTFYVIISTFLGHNYYLVSQNFGFLVIIMTKITWYFLVSHNFDLRHNLDFYLLILPFKSQFFTTRSHLLSLICHTFYVIILTFISHNSDYFCRPRSIILCKACMLNCVRDRPEL